MCKGRLFVNGTISLPHGCGDDSQRNILNFVKKSCQTNQRVVREVLIDMSGGWILCIPSNDLGNRGDRVQPCPRPSPHPHQTTPHRHLNQLPPHNRQPRLPTHSPHAPHRRPRPRANIPAPPIQHSPTPRASPLWSPLLRSSSPLRPMLTVEQGS